jgi:pimeloyl-ACP methyl ester carboxylesterase
MFARVFRTGLKITLWLGAIVLAMLLLGIVYIVYVVNSFDTTTLPARYAQVDAKLYATPGAARPLLVGLGGAEGGNSWTRDYWKAQRERFQAQGYAFLAIGYFGTPTTPERLDRIALEGVMAAISEAQADPRVGGDCTILLGGSKGAELALTLAAHHPQINAVIALAPADTVFPAHTDAMTTSSWALNGEQLVFAPMPWLATLDLLSGNIGAVMERILAQDEAIAAAIAVEQIAGPILLVAADRDEMWPALRMAERIQQRLKRAGFAHPHELVSVAGDHAEVIQHMPRVEEFLARVVAAQAGCAVPTAQ